ncbi:hypothetical protein [Lysobacter sp. 1R34A]|uniref:hypothetical protein n=1 Tax=Lysobacter sp. 1R34A TaxID=3445786 RepID=UPI003EEB8EF4
MNPKDLVVFLEQYPGRSQRLAFAAALAKRWQAHLIATFVTQPLALNPHASFAVGRAISAVLDDYLAAASAASAQARAEFDSLTARRSFTSEWRVSQDETCEGLMLHARHASLAVLGPPSRQTRPATMLSLAEDSIFASGRPCLLVPDDWSDERIGSRIVVGWNGGREAARAIADNGDYGDYGDPAPGERKYLYIVWSNNGATDSGVVGEDDDRGIIVP